jgi:hypothetical protein
MTLSSQTREQYQFAYGESEFASLVFTGSGRTTGSCMLCDQASEALFTSRYLHRLQLGNGGDGVCGRYQLCNSDGNHPSACTGP